MSGDEHTSSIFELTSYADEPILRKDFKPWHAPRKQYVREFQWLEETLRLTPCLPDGRPLTYLGLPGEDFLDVRVLQEHVGARVKYVAFNTDPKSTTVTVSLQQIRNLPHIDPDSIVMSDDFRSLADRDSVAFGNAKDEAPFDLVNLDLCGSVLKDELGNRSLYAAITNLLWLQRGRHEPWLFLLTTRTDPEGVHPDATAKLDDQLRRSRDDCADFDSTFAAEVAGPDKTLAGCGSGDRMYIFCVALATWILAAGEKYESSVTIESAMTYRIAPGSGPDDMLSLALLITPPDGPSADPSGMTPASGLAAFDACASAKVVAKAATKRTEVDVTLANDPNLAKQMRDDTAELLEAAGYDVPQYLAWVAASGSLQPRG